MELCSSFRVIFGLFEASLINALLAMSVSFVGWPSHSRVVVVPYSFHFLIMDLMVLRGMFKVLDIFLEPNPDLYISTTLSLTCLESSLVFLVWLAWWCALLSGVADSVVFQNRYILYVVCGFYMCVFVPVCLTLHSPCCSIRCISICFLFPVK